MSNIFFKKKCTKIPNISNKNVNFYKKINNVSYPKYYLPANNEWFNSIYAYNKNYLKFLPRHNKMAIKLIKSFFNLHFLKYKNKQKFNRRRLRIRSRRLLTSKTILVSKPEIKHTNTKTIFTVYIYNTDKRYLINKLNKKINPILRLSNKRFIKKIKLINKKSFKFIKLTKQIIKNLNLRKIKITKSSKKNNKKAIYKYPLILENFIKKSLRKEKLSIYYKHLVWFNKSKFENTYLYKLNKLITSFYNKKIEFNLINLKYLHLNSSILSQFVAIKLKKRKNRFRKLLKLFFNKLKLPHFNKWKSFNYLHLPLNSYLYGFFLMKAIPKKNFKNTDFFNQLLQKKNKQFLFNKKLIKDEHFFVKKKFVKNYIVNTNQIFNIIKHRSVSGVRLDLSGRLTRRFVAARSLYKKKYKGSLKNIDSSYKGLSCVILRGHLKSNIQYTKLSSKIRIGSFGIKGWISTF